MNRRTTITLALLLALPTAVFGQGDLTPPGPPGETMKSLDQIEARTPIASAPLTISTSGSYYLTGNLTVATGNAITINADQVTLDLNGFAISSTHATGNGTAVLINGTGRNVTIRNGHIRGTTTFAAGAFTTGGFLSGISNTVSTSANLRVSDINVLGVAEHGINLASRTVPTFVIERCTASVCGSIGLQAGLVKDSSADTTGTTAIFADIATHCSGETVDAVAFSSGVNTLSVAENCRGVAVSGPGVASSSIASNCFGISTAGNGINATLAHNCEGRTTSGTFGINLGTTSGIASFCRGQRNGGVAIQAFNAIGCSVLGTGTVTATNKSLGTPTP